MLKKIYQEMDITFDNVNYKVPVSRHSKEKKVVLKNVSGKFKSGELTAIMGPSGAGKSTLLNILTGFSKKGVKGSIAFGAENNKKLYHKQCSYILQDDNLYPFFTVNEAMIIACNLKISNTNLSEKERYILINDILNTLNLQHAKDTKCGNLSGGQKKRLSIALELIDNPPILFLDEPTTGLDSSASSYCITLLHQLAKKGRTIVCTIHQPQASIFAKFDHVYVLTDGQCIYQGAAYNTVDYLSTIGLNCPQYHSPADYLIEVANGEYGDYKQILSEAAISDYWRYNNVQLENVQNQMVNFDMDTGNNNDINSYNPSADKNEYIKKPPEWQILWYIINRCNIQLFRDWTVTHLKLLLHVCCGVLVGLLFGNSGINATKTVSNIGVLLIGLVYLWYTTLMPGILKFPAEVPILKKETFNSWYKFRTFFLASMITTTPIHIIYSIVYSSIVYALTEQPLEFDRIWKFILVHILITLAADSFGIVLGSLFDPVNGTFIGAVCTCFKTVFSGFLIFYPYIPQFLLPFAYISILRYGLEALVLTLYDNNRKDFFCPDGVMYCHYMNPNIVLNELGMKQNNFYFCIGMIVLQIVIFKIASYFLLRRKLRSE